MRIGDKVKVINTHPQYTQRTGKIIRQYAPGGKILGYMVRPDLPLPGDIFEVEDLWCWYTKDLEVIHEQS